MSRATISCLFKISIGVSSFFPGPVINLQKCRVHVPLRHPLLSTSQYLLAFSDMALTTSYLCRCFIHDKYLPIVSGGNSTLKCLRSRPVALSLFAPPTVASRNWDSRCGGQSARRSPPPDSRTTGSGRRSHTRRLPGESAKPVTGGSLIFKFCMLYARQKLAAPR